MYNGGTDFRNAENNWKIHSIETEDVGRQVDLVKEI